MASPTADPKKGSSPAPSLTLPQRGSRAMSTIGEKVQLSPSAVASTAATLAVCSTKSMFHVQLNPSGMGKMVRWPCITSNPNNSGMPRRVSLIAFCCSLRTATGVKVLNTPPTMPFWILPSTSFDSTGPVTSKPTVGRFNCPIFSSKVILAMRSDT